MRRLQALQALPVGDGGAASGASNEGGRLEDSGGDDAGGEAESSSVEDSQAEDSGQGESEGSLRRVRTMLALRYVYGSWQLAGPWFRDTCVLR